MLQDIPYNVLKEDPREYAILLRRDQNGAAWKEIAREFGLSPTRVAQIYRKMKLRQIRLYIRHVSIVQGVRPGAGPKGVQQGPGVVPEPGLRLRVFGKEVPQYFGPVPARASRACRRRLPQTCRPSGTGWPKAR